MTVYNGETYLRETVDSILGQTYTDFIFLVLDNASTDRSREIIRSYDDPRIKLEALPENIGQIAALNKGLEMIDTPYVARMDADDISPPERFEQQVAYLDDHPDTGICGTQAIVFDGKKETRIKLPRTHDDLNVRLLFECCISHGSVMMRKPLLDKYNLRYSETLGHSEDWELWQRAGRHFRLVNLPGYLIRYRVHEKSESYRISHRQREAAETLDKASLGYLGLDTHPLRPVHRDTSFTTFNVKNRGPEFLDRVIQWFGILESANAQHNVYSRETLRRFLKDRLFIVLHYNTRYRGTVLKIFFKEKLFRTVGVFRSVKFVVKVFLSVFGFKTR
jgi:glycosyltransferase involved in cell wall biosynthesis